MLQMELIPSAPAGGGDMVQPFEYAYLLNSSGTLRDNLVINGGVLCECPDTDDVTLSNLEVIGSAVDGIKVNTGATDSTVYVENCVIHGCNRGVCVTNDSVVITNPDIYNCDYGVYAGPNSSVTVTGGSIHDGRSGPPAPEPGANGTA